MHVSRAPNSTPFYNNNNKNSNPFKEQSRPILRQTMQYDESKEHLQAVTEIPFSNLLIL